MDQEGTSNGTNESTDVSNENDDPGDGKKLHSIPKSSFEVEAGLLRFPASIDVLSQQHRERQQRESNIKLRTSPISGLARLCFSSDFDSWQGTSPVAVHSGVLIGRKAEVFEKARDRSAARLSLSSILTDLGNPGDWRAQDSRHPGHSGDGRRICVNSVSFGSGRHEGSAKAPF